MNIAALLTPENLVAVRMVAEQLGMHAQQLAPIGQELLKIVKEVVPGARGIGSWQDVLNTTTSSAPWNAPVAWDQVGKVMGKIAEWLDNANQLRETAQNIKDTGAVDFAKVLAKAVIDPHHHHHLKHLAEEFRSLASHLIKPAAHTGEPASVASLPIVPTPVASQLGG